MLAGLLCSLPAYPVDNTSKHLEKLQILIDHNLPYDREMSSDSIILLEKELEPKLEADKRYDLLFYPWIHLRSVFFSYYTRKFVRL